MFSMSVRYYIFNYILMLTKDVIIISGTELLYTFIKIFLYCRFASMSVGSSEQNVKVTHPVYGTGIMPSISHTYINQYAGSEFNLDKQHVGI